MQPRSHIKSFDFQRKRLKIIVLMQRIRRAAPLRKPATARPHLSRPSLVAVSGFWSRQNTNSAAPIRPADLAQKAHRASPYRGFHFLAKEDVASSSLVTRSKLVSGPAITHTFTSPVPPAARCSPSLARIGDRDRCNLDCLCAKLLGAFLESRVRKFQFFA